MSNPLSAVDPAKGGYYTVHIIPPSHRSRTTHEVKGYSKDGKLLLHTWHVGQSSVDMETQAWRNRGATELKS